MTRKEKIKLLQDIKAGVKKIASLFEPIRPIWVFDESTGMLSCKELDMIRKEKDLPTRLNGRDIKNILVYPGRKCAIDIKESED